MRLGPYELGNVIGRGGTGTVYASRGADGSSLAVKVVSNLTAASRDRFERERRLHATLGENDGFVPLVDGGWQGEVAYLVMPFVGGGTLRKRIDRGPLDVDDALELGVTLARALGRAHALGIVHRDLKPENVLFTEDGRPLVTDLGLAKHFDTTAPAASASLALSQTNAFRGTAAYAAPEQLEDARKADARSDVYALGAVLYECLAGRPAIEATDVMELLARALDARHEPLRDARPDAPAWLVAAIERALARDPEARFPDGEAFARALESPATSGRAKGLLAATVLGAVGAAVAIGIVGRSASGGAPASRPDVRPAVAPPEPPAAPAAPSQRAVAERFVAAGDEKRAAKDLAGARAEYDEALAADPSWASTWRKRGAVRALAGDHEGALADTDRAIELDPKDHLAHLNRGLALSNLWRVDEAFESLRRATEVGPTHAQSWYAYGLVLGVKGDHASAVAAFTRAIELDGADLAECYFSRGVARFKASKDVDGAIADYDRALAVNPKHANAYHNRAALRFTVKKDRAGAIADVARAVECDPRFAAAWHAQGTYLRAEGRLDEAEASFRRFLELARPDDTLRAPTEKWLAERAARGR